MKDKSQLEVTPIVEKPFGSSGLEMTAIAPELEPVARSLFGSKGGIPRSIMHDMMKKASSAMTSMLKRPELVAFVNDGPKYESIYDLSEAFGIDGFEQFLMDLEGLIEQGRRLLKLASLFNACERLILRSWGSEPPNPSPAELRALERVIGRWARRLYGFPNHRSSVNQDRDRKLWRLKKRHPSWSWGTLGLKFEISNGAAELAYKRQAAREKQRLNQLCRDVRRRLEFMMDVTCCPSPVLEPERDVTTDEIRNMSPGRQTTNEVVARDGIRVDSNHRALSQHATGNGPRRQ
jgi:hypothetical protein